MGTRSNRVVALLVALCVAVAPALYAAPAAGMTLQLNIGNTVSHDCDCCPGTKPDRNICVLMCVSAVPLATTDASKLPVVAIPDDYAPKFELTPSSLATRPEPPPPRPIALG
jgi:hypothetical protein